LSLAATVLPKILGHGTVKVDVKLTLNQFQVNFDDTKMYPSE